MYRSYSVFVTPLNATIVKYCSSGGDSGGQREKSLLHYLMHLNHVLTHKTWRANSPPVCLPILHLSSVITGTDRCQVTTPQPGGSQGTRLDDCFKPSTLKTASPATQWSNLNGLVCPLACHHRSIKAAITLPFITKSFGLH